MTVEDTEKLFAALLGVVTIWAVLIAAATEFVKRVLTMLPTEAYPVVALAFGMAAGLLYIAPGDPRMGALYGFAATLASLGLYSGGKAVIGKS